MAQVKLTNSISVNPEHVASVVANDTSVTVVMASGQQHGIPAHELSPTRCNKSELLRFVVDKLNSSPDLSVKPREVDHGAP